MKIHRNLCQAVVDSLEDIFSNDRYADKVIQRILKRDKRWGSRDRGFIAETVYEIVRYKRLFLEVSRLNEPLKKTDFWNLLAAYLVVNDHPLPEWPEFKNFSQKTALANYRKALKQRRLRESVPDWLDDIGLSELGKERWTQEIKALNEPASVVIRANTLKTDKTKLQKALAGEGIKTSTISGYPEALQLEERKNVFKSDWFKKGHFEVQDASSQMVSHFLQVKPGMKVVDACAGGGGKSLHLAALMENKGMLIAMDIFDYKLTELKKRARRAGVHNLNIRLIDSTKPIKKLKGQADRLLIDAPCSGLGVLKRNPDAKWKLSEDFLNRVQQTQKDIIHSYSDMVKPGGLMVYATCSILPSENNAQIEHFLESDKGKDFIFVEDQTILPSESGFDGFYMARLQRKN